MKPKTVHVRIAHPAQKRDGCFTTKADRVTQAITRLATQVAEQSKFSSVAQTALETAAVGLERSALAQLPTAG